VGDTIYVLAGGLTPGGGTPSALNEALFLR
jgi:hypothetical protein